MSNGTYPIFVTIVQSIEIIATLSARVVLSSYVQEFLPNLGEDATIRYFQRAGIPVRGLPRLDFEGLALP